LFVLLFGELRPWLWFAFKDQLHLTHSNIRIDIHFVEIGIDRRRSESGLGCRVLGFRVGFRILGFRVQGFRVCTIPVTDSNTWPGVGFRV
jgi:hypothetical protein